MKITLAEPRGFCSGVRRAVHILTELVDSTAAPVFVYHEIVHNKTVVAQFAAKGVRFVGSLANVPAGSTVLFSAHGVSPAVREIAAARHLRTVDATCPLVARIHDNVRSFAHRGFQIVLIGYPGHDEVVGTLGEAPGQITLISCRDDVDRLSFPTGTPLVCLTQTTLLASFVEELMAMLTARYPQLVVPEHGGICQATRDHQHALRYPGFRPDLVLVVGSPESSNSRRLVEVARESGFKAALVDSPEQIDLDHLSGTEHILITAGASAPEEMVQRCVAAIQSRFPDSFPERPVP